MYWLGMTTDNLKPLANKHAKLQRGVSMIEVLVTLFILSVGLLGVASMQFISSFSNKQALARTQAIMIAQQMSERLRASTLSSTVTDGFIVDNAYFNAGNYNFTDLECNSGQGDFACYCDEIPAEIPNCNDGECSSAQIAQFDAYEMSCALESANPVATINVSCDDKDNTDADSCTAGSIHQITVRWPTTNWQNNNTVRNDNCTQEEGQAYDCVILEVTL